MADLLNLPIGIQNFEKLRRANKLYVDKTAYLAKLVEVVPCCFLSRPRRFGKSLTLSTLEAMFQGKTELFRGLAAEEWVKKQAVQPAPVLRLDMSSMETGEGSAGLKRSLKEELIYRAEDDNLVISGQSPEGLLKSLLRKLYKAHGSVAVLIDEYDKPILDNIGDQKRAEEMRVVLHSFYTIIKACDQYTCFLMLTGISKFSKLGIFSGMNNLLDISLNPDWGALVGYTQAELESNFSGWLDRAAWKMQINRGEMLERMKSYYDGFCFDGVTKLYNPFSVLSFLNDATFANYWYSTASPSFIIHYLRRHEISLPNDYRHIQVGADFTEAQEIEKARPESFLYQAGYLTIEKRVENQLTLDYPNEEVMNAMAKTYLANVCRLNDYTPLGSQLWEALRDGDLDEAVRLYNSALAGIPGELFGKAKPSEALYNALFLMLLRGAGITCGGEIPNAQGRSDTVILLPNRVVVFEFKLARARTEWERLLEDGKKQITEKKYADAWRDGGRIVTAAAVVIDAESRQAVKWG